MTQGPERHAIPSDDALALVADRFRALADPLRLRLLRELMDGERSVQELVSRTGILQPSVSKHLAVLRAEGIVLRRPRGASVFYSIADPSVLELCEIVCRGLERRLSGHLEALSRPATRRSARR
ncbi:HTH-type transcriptional repressor CzrA [Myxococcaceae bacterium]|jgi:ArsR family transcriptional regulator|nr:HTH-type transcriptional repressor CzrA [Myxococcaceae bacterium]